MRCSLLLCIFWLIIGGNALAQSNEVTISKSPFIPYFVGGLNWTSISGVQDNSEIRPFATFNAGVGVLTLISKPAPLSLTVEAFFSEQGFKLNNVNRGSSAEYMKFRYVNIPAVVRFNLSKTSNFYIGVGPQVGFYIDGKIITKDGSKLDFREGIINKTALDAVGTIGTYLNDKADTGIELRFQGGLNKFMTSEPDYRHSVLQLRMILPMFFL
ncbi:MAG TPA: outer membrane beta-barrel protein [Daejeonella sp.]|nr:outer membrane beta-barrel protein [Daejeonella sp.]